MAQLNINFCKFKIILFKFASQGLPKTKTTVHITGTTHVYEKVVYIFVAQEKRQIKNNNKINFLNFVLYSLFVYLATLK